MSMPPGWYQDPSNPNGHRYWNGVAWQQIQAPSPKRQSTPRLFVSIVVVLCVAAAVAYWLTRKHSSDPSPQAPVSSTHTIVYELTGTATSADLTYSLATGGSEQQQGVDVPLTRKSDGKPGIEFTADEGAFLYFSAQNNGGGSLTCKITEDGVVLDEKTSSGEFTIVSCEGRA